MTSNQQVVDGFGFSTAWCGQLSSAKNTALYDTLGMSLLRIRISPDRNWTAEAANASAAHAHGAKVLGTSWTPPASMKDNNNVVGGTLRSDQYAAYASWLNQAANTIGLDWVSFQNEPDISVNYDSCDWTPSQMLNFCRNNASSVGKPVVMPESYHFDDAWSDPVLNDSVAIDNVAIVGGHIYGGGLRTHQNAVDKGKRVWMTEHYIANTQSDMNRCILIAKEISDCMHARMNAYFWWWVADYDSSVNLVNSGGAIFKNGYTIGQFAKFIRPRSTRVGADYNPSTNILVTAYRVNGGCTIVAVNAGDVSVNQQFNLLNSDASSFAVTRTSSSQNMASLGNVGVGAGSFTATLPPKSVTTFVQAGSSPIANGTYRITARHSGQALDAYGSRTNDGTQLCQWPYNGTTNQQWKVSYLGDGEYSIIGVQSGKSADVNYGYSDNGTKVQLWGYWGGSMQRFHFIHIGGGYYRISPTCAPNSCLDVAGVSTSNGAYVQLWIYVGGGNQQWSLQAP